MSDKTPAWLLHVAENIQFSIGEHQASEYIETPILQHVPLAAPFCKSIIFWHGVPVPVIDMNILFGHSEAKNTKHLMVVAYQTEDNTPLQQVAFLLASAPEKIVVDDDDACELPDIYPEVLKPFVLSFFNYNQHATSIFDIAQLSSNNLQA